MGKTSENPVKHVVSFRVNDGEKELLEEIARESGMNISTLIRETLFLVEENVNDAYRRLRKQRFGEGKAKRLLNANSHGEFHRYELASNREMRP